MMPVKRSSKISLALRKNFISAVVDDGMTIKKVLNILKKAAAKFKLNYSTAKVIFQNFRAEEEANFYDPNEKDMKDKSIRNFRNQKELERERRRCYYKEISQPSTGSSSDSTEGSCHSKIKIISTVAWNFMVDGIPNSS